VGDIARVVELLDEAEALAHRLAQPHLVWLISFSRTGLAIMLGELAQAEAEAGRSLALGNELGRGQEAWLFHLQQLGEIRRLQGRLGELDGPLRDLVRIPGADKARELLRLLCQLGADEAPQRFEDAVAGGVLPRRDLGERAALDNLALAASWLSRHDVVDRLYEALLPYGDTFGHSTVAHHCGHHYLGLLAAAAGRNGQAAAHFASAAEIHERRGVPLLLAESLIDWAELLDGAGTGAAGREAAALRERARAAISDRGVVLLDRRLELAGP
jgi:hypothetical protein